MQKTKCHAWRLAWNSPVKFHSSVFTPVLWPDSGGIKEKIPPVFILHCSLIAAHAEEKALYTRYDRFYSLRLWKHLYCYNQPHAVCVCGTARWCQPQFQATHCSNVTLSSWEIHCTAESISTPQQCLLCRGSKCYIRQKASLPLSMKEQNGNGLLCVCRECVHVYGTLSQWQEDECSDLFSWKFQLCPVWHFHRWGRSVTVYTGGIYLSCIYGCY